VDGGAHPNPRKAVEGYRLRLLAIDEPAAEVVRRMFMEYLDGVGDRAIAAGLNRDAIPCPSARRPEQNRHRLGDGWQGSTVRAVLENPRYTGYAVFGRWTKHEMLLDPDDVAAGHVVRFRRSEPDRVVRSRRPAHPAIVTVEMFTQAQLMRRRSRAAGGMRGRAKLERTRRTGTRPYVLRGLVRCGICTRRMIGATIRDREAYYRCLARSLAPGSPVLAEHPRTVNVREIDIVERLNDWLGYVFARENLDRTVAGLLSSQEGDHPASGAREGAKARLVNAEAKLRRFQAAIEAGIDPTAIVDAVNETQAQRVAAKAELEGLPSPGLITRAEVYARIDSLGDVGVALRRASPDKLSALYHDLGVELRFHPEERTVLATASPRVVSECVRGGTRARKSVRRPQSGGVSRGDRSTAREWGKPTSRRPCHRSKDGTGGSLKPPLTTLALRCRSRV
jgi:hypothetical protein